MKGQYYNIYVTRIGQNEPDPTPVAQAFGISAAAAKDSANKVLRGQRFNLPRTIAEPVQPKLKSFPIRRPSSNQTEKQS